MDSHFDQPQRQSAIGIFVLFAQTFEHYIRAFLPLLLLWVLKYDQVDKIYIISVLIVVTVVIAIIAYLKYLNFTFYLDYKNNEFVLQEGIFNKSKTIVQLQKIQQVHITQSFVQRIIGVYSLEVDTAGSASKEGKISAIAYPLALELKAALLQNSKPVLDKEDPNLSEIESTEEHPLHIKISFLSLLKIGITSNYIKSLSLILIFFFTVFDNIERVSSNSIVKDTDLWDYLINTLLLQSFFVAIALLVILVLVVNLIRIVVRYFDFKITRQKGSLVISYGLFNTSNTIIKPEKVQITAVSSNYFQKKMNVLEMKIKQASSSEKEEHQLAIEIPGFNKEERNAILNLIFEKFPALGVELKPNYRKLGFAVFLTIVLPVSLFLFLIKSIPSIDISVEYFIPVYILFVGCIQYFRFMNHRLYINDDFIIKKSGAWDVCHEIIEPSKIQAITTSQLFWHKGIDIGSIILHTAGGTIRFQLGNFTEIKNYVNCWLYELEKSDSNWM